IMIDPAIRQYITQTETVDKTVEVIEDGVTHYITYTTVVNNSVYEDKYLGLAVQVDAVQTHSAENAITSCWGKHVEIDDNGVITALD
ncbi:MAG: hypothetical protein IJI05_00115, partial [Erysipelotrichaceae bacterium]|nr:hypothetical protein [Erysipelotrichaceae bacterium]